MFKTIKRVLLTLIVVLLVAGVALGGYAYFKFKDIWGDPLAVLRGVMGGLDLSRIVNYGSGSYRYNQDIVTLLLIGIDEDEGRSSARSDLMAIMAMDLSAKKARIIVCPRDTRANVRMTDDRGNPTGEQVAKLNASFPYGGGNNNKERGGENVMFNVEKLLSCNGQYTVPLLKYGGINMRGISPLTEAVGGVDITLPESMEGIGNKGERVTLNGSQAERYCTARKGVGDGSDISRGQRQMVYMMSLMQEIKGLGASNILSVYSSVSGYSFTNLSTDEMVAYASYLADIPSENMDTVQLKGTAQTIDGASYYVLDEAALEQLVIETFYRQV